VVYTPPSLTETFHWASGFFKFVLPTWSENRDEYVPQDSQGHYKTLADEETLELAIRKVEGEFR
jgi:hypothetical protein